MVMVMERNETAVEIISAYFEEHKKLMCSKAYAICKNFDDCEDAWAASRLKLIQNPELLNGLSRGQIITYMITCVLNYVRDVLRKSNWISISLDCDYGSIDPDTDWTDNLKNLMAADEYEAVNGSQILKDIERFLGPFEFSVLVLDMYGESAKEASERLGVGLTAYKSRLYRVRDKVYWYLRDRGYEDYPSIKPITRVILENGKELSKEKAKKAKELPPIDDVLKELFGEDFDAG